MVHTRKFLCFVLFFFIFIADSPAQGDQEKAIMNVINSVFEGMATNNGDLIRAAFSDDAQTFTVFVDEEGITQKRPGSVEKFAEAVDKEKALQWTEPIWNEKIEIDGPLASVWVDYAFYLGADFHHCGVDAFHLIQTAGEWKIFHLVDTRRTEDCDVPQYIKDSYD